MSVVTPPPPTMMDAGDAIAALIDGAREVDLGTSSGRDLLSVVGQLGQLRHIIDHLTSQAVRKVDRSGAWVEQGARSPQASVRSQTGCSKALANSEVMLSRALPDIPAMAAGYASGAVSREHMLIVARALPRPGCRESIGDHDAQFAAYAAQFRPEEFQRLVTRWVDMVDATTQAAEHADKSLGAYLKVSTTIDGMVAVDGMLDPETGASLQVALHSIRIRHAKARDKAEAAAAHERSADQLDLADSTQTATTGQPVVGDSAPEQSFSQRNVAALAELISLAMGNNNAPSVTDGLPTQVTVTMTLEALRSDLDDVDADQSAEQSTGGGDRRIIPAAAARRMACDAGILPAVLGGNGEILNLGRAVRTVTFAQRRAIEIRDQHCRYPDCDHPVQHVHHIIFWANGGKSDMSNLVGLCNFHHHTVHDYGHKLEGNANSRITVTAPDRPIGTTWPRSRPVDGITLPIQRQGQGQGQGQGQAQQYTQAPKRQ